MRRRTCGDTPLYDRPQLYERLHEPGSAEEAALVLDLFRLHGNGGKDALEPACGTGRLLGRLSGKGLRCTGYDLSAKALAYGRKRRLGIEFARASMTSFCRPEAFDLAFNLIGTFRHLMGDADALCHLRLTAASLRQGGIYVVQLDLSDYENQADDEESWTIGLGAARIEHVMMSLAPDRRRRRERIIHFVSTGGGRFQDEYDLRSYDLAQWQTLIARSPFRIKAASLFPAQGPGVRDGVFVLSLLE